MRTSTSLLEQHPPLRLGGQWVVKLRTSPFVVEREGLEVWRREKEEEGREGGKGKKGKGKGRRQMPRQMDWALGSALLTNFPLQSPGRSLNETSLSIWDASRMKLISLARRASCFPTGSRKLEGSGKPGQQPVFV